MCVFVVISYPLLDNYQVHVPEKSEKHYDLRNKLENELEPTLPVNCVEAFHNNAK